MGSDSMTSYPALILCFLFLGVTPTQSLRYKSEETRDWECALCQTVMELPDQYITQEDTEQEVAAALGQICALLPSPLDLPGNDTGIHGRYNRAHSQPVPLT